MACTTEYMLAEVKHRPVHKLTCHSRIMTDQCPNRRLIAPSSSPFVVTNDVDKVNWPTRPQLIYLTCQEQFVLSGLLAWSDVVNKE